MGTITTRQLDRLENEILDKVLTDTVAGEVRTVPVTRQHWDGSGEYEAQDWPALAYIVWIDELGVQFGPVRWGHPNSTPGQCDRWSASPFSGAWAMVSRDQIIRVRHGGTL